jgi:hypothetical protein
MSRLKQCGIDAAAVVTLLRGLARWQRRPAPERQRQRLHCPLRRGCVSAARTHQLQQRGHDERHHRVVADVQPRDLPVVALDEHEIRVHELGGLGDQVDCSGRAEQNGRFKSSMVSPEA